MSDSFQSLLEATRADDQAGVKVLMREDPSLPTRRVGSDKIHEYEPGFAHWIYSGDTALHVAAAGYRVEIAKVLLSAGAAVDAAGNRRSSQPLHYASDGSLEGPGWNPARQVAMIRLLIDAGADVRVKDRNGATPLHRAVRTRCAAAVKFLLGAGADPASRNKPGSTPFHLAVQNTGRGGSGSEKARAAQLEIIRAFLECRVSPTLEDAKGRSVLEWVRNDPVREIFGMADV